MDGIDNSLSQVTIDFVSISLKRVRASEIGRQVESVFRSDELTGLAGKSRELFRRFLGQAEKTEGTMAGVNYRHAIDHATSIEDLLKVAESAHYNNGPNPRMIALAQATMTSQSPAQALRVAEVAKRLSDEHSKVAAVRKAIELCHTHDAALVIARHIRSLDSSMEGSINMALYHATSLSRSPAQALEVVKLANEWNFKAAANHALDVANELAHRHD